MREDHPIDHLVVMVEGPASASVAARPGTVTACDHSPESLALPRCLVMCCAGLRWAVLSRPGVRGTTDDGADEQRVGQVESH